MKQSIIIADDHLLFLWGMEEFFQSIPQIDLLASISNGFEVAEQVKLLQPDILLLDLNFKNIYGFDILKEIRKHTGKQPKVVFVTMYDDPAIILKAKQLGANAFFLKETEPEELVNAILHLRNNQFISPVQLSAKSLETATIPFSDSFEADTMLTARETDILRQIARGKSSKEIGELLFISSTTVDTHRKNIQKKLGLNKISELVKYAVAHHIN